MRIYVALAIIAILMAALAGCGTVEQPASEEPAGTVQMTNPISESSAEEIKEQLGIELTIPQESENVSFVTIRAGSSEADRVAQAKFTYHSIGVCLRAQSADQPADISGMYYEWQTELEITAENGISVSLYLNEGEQGIACWYDTEKGLNYSISVDTSASADLLTTLVNEVSRTE